MLVWLKNPTTGVFEKSGNFPSDCRAQIAVDTAKPSGDYTLDEALAIVGEAIGKGKSVEHYRYEIHPTTASQLKHRVKAKSVRPKTKTAFKKESGKQRRARLKAAGICTACGKRKAAPGRPECRQCIRYYHDWAKARAKSGKAIKRAVR